MELKACPFCGAKVLGPCRADYYGAFYIIKHEESCFFKTIFGQHETTIRERSGKINVWNTRATDPTEVSKKCTCDMRTSLVGDGCRYCNPQYYIEMLEDQIKEGDSLVEEIAKWLREAAPYLDEKTERMYLKCAYQVENMRCENCAHSPDDISICETDEPVWECIFVDGTHSKSFGCWHFELRVK